MRSMNEMVNIDMVELNTHSNNWKGVNAIHSQEKKKLKSRKYKRELAKQNQIKNDGDDSK